MNKDKFDLFLELLIETRRNHGDSELTISKLIELCKKVNMKYEIEEAKK